MKSPLTAHTDVSGKSYGGGVRTYVEIFLAILAAAVILKVFVIGVVHVPSHSMEGTIVSGDYLIVNKLIYGAHSPKRIPFLTAGFPSFRMPGLRGVERGDIIVFEFPDYDEIYHAYGETYFVKRCVATAGDTLSMNDGIVTVNGKRYSLQMNGESQSSENIKPLVIPKAGDIISLNEDNFSEYEKLIRQEGHTIEQVSAKEFLIDGVQTNSYVIQQNYLYVLGDNRAQSFDSRAWGFLPESNVVGQAAAVYWSMNPSAVISNVKDFYGAIRWDRVAKFIR